MGFSCGAVLVDRLDCVVPSAPDLTVYCSQESSTAFKSAVAVTPFTGFEF